VADPMMVTFRRERRCFSRLAYLKRDLQARRVINDPEGNLLGVQPTFLPLLYSFSYLLTLFSCSFLAIVIQVTIVIKNCENNWIYDTKEFSSIMCTHHYKIYFIFIPDTDVMSWVCVILWIVYEIKFHRYISLLYNINYVLLYN